MKTKSLNLDILVSPEIGLAILIFGIILIIYGYRQSKKEFDIDNLPFINPITKVIFGSFFVLFGIVQLLPVIRMLTE